jgi:hypothetical protein
MVLKRPDSLPNREPASGTDLVEHLVKKSLDINPSLRRGKDTREVLDALKKEAVARSRQGSASGEAQTSGAEPSRVNLADRRKSTMVFFLEQKSQEFEGGAADIEAREKLLAREKQDLQKRFAEDIVDFLALMSGSTENPETREVLKDFRGFLTRLGITDQDLLRLAKNRR